MWVDHKGCKVACECLSEWVWWYARSWDQYCDLSAYFEDVSISPISSALRTTEVLCDYVPLGIPAHLVLTVSRSPAGVLVHWCHPTVARYRQFPANTSDKHHFIHTVTAISIMTDHLPHSSPDQLTTWFTSHSTGLTAYIYYVNNRRKW